MSGAEQRRLAVDDPCAAPLASAYIGPTSALHGMQIKRTQQIKCTLLTVVADVIEETENESPPVDDCRDGFVSRTTLCDCGHLGQLGHLDSLQRKYCLFAPLFMTTDFMARQVNVHHFPLHGLLNFVPLPPH